MYRERVEAALLQGQVILVGQCMKYSWSEGTMYYRYRNHGRWVPSEFDSIEQFLDSLERNDCEVMIL